MFLFLKFTCCGVDSYSDWINDTYETAFSTNEGYEVPSSCCKEYSNMEYCMKHPKEILEEHSIKGCFTLLYDTLGQDKFAISMGATTIAIFLVRQI